MVMGGVGSEVRVPASWAAVALLCPVHPHRQRWVVRDVQVELARRCIAHRPGSMCRPIIDTLRTFPCPIVGIGSVQERALSALR